MTESNSSQGELDSSTVYKLLTLDEWAHAVVAGAYTGSPDDARDGFVHLSLAHQLDATAAKYFRGIEDLCLVAFGTADLGPALKFEPSRGGDLFPHLYGPLPAHAALWVAPVPLAADGIPLIAPALSTALADAEPTQA